MHREVVEGDLPARPLKVVDSCGALAGLVNFQALVLHARSRRCPNASSQAEGTYVPSRSAISNATV